MEFEKDQKKPMNPEELQSEERQYEQEKLGVSEGIRRERDSTREQQKNPEGYEQHPAEARTYEVFGLKNSFDNLSVSADELGRMTLTVSSQRSYHGTSPDNTKKKLRGSRRRTKYEHWGDFYTDPAARGMGAFAFRTRKNLPEHRILREFKGNAAKYVNPARLEALPFLTLDEDREYLAELRSKDGRTAGEVGERLAVEQAIVRKTELENRFIRKLRIARRRTYMKHSPLYDEPERIVKSITDGAEDNGTDENGASETGAQGTGAQGSGAQGNETPATGEPAGGRQDNGTRTES